MSVAQFSTAECAVAIAASGISNLPFTRKEGQRTILLPGWRNRAGTVVTKESWVEQRGSERGSFVEVRCACGRPLVMRQKNLLGHPDRRCRSCGSSAGQHGDGAMRITPELLTSCREAYPEASEAEVREACQAMAMRFRNAKQRCIDPTDADYNRYGGSGVRFDYESPLHIVESLGWPPTIDGGWQLEKDANGPGNRHYSPACGNRWASGKENARRRESCRSVRWGDAAVPVWSIVEALGYVRAEDRIKYQLFYDALNRRLFWPGGNKIDNPDWRRVINALVRPLPSADYPGMTPRDAIALMDKLAGVRGEDEDDDDEAA